MSPARLGFAALLLLACGPAASAVDNKAPGGGSEQRAFDVVVLIQGSFVWMGNEQYQSAAEDTVYEGAHGQLAPALAALASALPPGSQIAVVIDNELAQPLVPASSLAPAEVIGDQKRYAEHIARELIGGLDQAASIFARSKAPGQAVIAIGDGLDNIERGPVSAAISERVAAMRRDGVLGYSVHYQPYAGAGADDVADGRANLAIIGYTLARIAESSGDLPGMVGAIGAAMGSR